MGLRKQYRGYAVGTTLAIEASAGATSFTVAGSGGASFPSTGVPFVITIDRGLSTEEIMEAIAAAKAKKGL
jgi:hypothetical protein